LTYLNRYYSCAHESAKVWSQLCKLSRSQLHENVHIFSQFLKNKKLIKIREASEAALSYMLTWLPFLRLDIVTSSTAAEDRLLKKIIDIKEGNGTYYHFKEMEINQFTFRKDSKPMLEISKIVQEDFETTQVLHLS